MKQILKLLTVSAVVAYAVKHGLHLWLNIQVECASCAQRSWQTGFEVMPNDLEEALQGQVMAQKQENCGCPHPLFPEQTCGGAENICAFGVGICGYPGWGRVNEEFVKGGEDRPWGEVTVPPDALTAIGTHKGKCGACGEEMQVSEWMDDRGYYKWGTVCASCYKKEVHHV